MSKATTPSQYMVKKNNKFEAKLARYLICKPGDQLLGYDACIQKDGRSIIYRLIVLGLDSIYLPQNPPKPDEFEKPLVQYCDVLRAEVIDDYPDFLLGKERENTMHLRLRIVLRSEKIKKSKKKEELAANEMHTIQGLLDPNSLENINNYMEPLTPRGATSSRSATLVPLPQLSAAIPLALSSSSSTDEATSRMNTARSDTSPYHLSLKQLESSSLPRSYSSSMEFKQRLEDLNLDTDRSNIQRLLSTPRLAAEESMSMKRSSSAKSLSKKKSNNDSDFNPDSPRFNRYLLRVHQDERYGTLHTPRGASHRTLEDEMTLATARSTMSTLSFMSSFNMNSSNSEQSSIYCPSVEEVRSLQDDANEDMKEVDLYFLNGNSRIPEILSSALTNFAVVATLNYQCDRKPTTLVGDHPPDSMDIVLRKFAELKREILMLYDDSDLLAPLTNELCAACQKYPKLKELFWKDHDLFPYYVKEFQHRCRKLISLSFDHDVIEESFSIMHLINELFLNSCSSAERLTRLEHDGCAHLEVLVRCLLTSPVSMIEKAAAPTTETTDEDVSEYKEKNAYKNALRWVMLSNGLIWYIGDMLMRPSWTPKNFRYRNFIELFETHQHRDEYFNIFIDALSRLVPSKESTEPLNPKHAVYIYQFFSILSMLLINSKTLARYLHDRYIEDFKYYIKEDILLTRIPVQYPIYRFIPELIRSVHYHMLHGKPNIDLLRRSKNHQLI